MAREISKRDAGGVRLPPNYQDVQSAAAKVHELRAEVTIGYAIPSQDLMARVDAALADADGLAKLAAAAQPGDRNEVVGHLGFLQMCFAGNAGAADTKVLGMLMAADVMSLKPSAAAVEIACREWRQTQRFLPSISEIMESVRREQNTLSAAVEFLKKLPDDRVKMQRNLDRE